MVCEVAVALARKGDVYSVFAILKSENLQENGFWCYLDIASAQAEEGDVDGAAETASHESNPSNRETIFGFAAHAAAAAGKLDAADKLFDLELEAARSVTDAVGRINSLCMVALAMSESGRSIGAVMFLPEMQSALPLVAKLQDREHALSEIAQAQAIVGNFANSEETIKGIAEVDRKDFTRWLLIRELIKNGDLVEASRVSRMLQTESYKAVGIRELTLAREKRGEIIGALSMVDPGSDKYDRDRANWTYAHIVIEQGKLGKNSEANQTARLITDDMVRAGTLIVLGSGAPLPDKDHVAATIFGEARAAALNIKELYFRAVALSHLAGVLSSRGEFVIAREAADAIPSDAEDEGMLGDLEKHKGHALENIAYWQCKIGTCEGTLEWVVRENSPILRSYAIAGAVEAILGLKPPSDHYVEENYGW